MSNDKNSILTTLKELKPTYEQEGTIYQLLKRYRHLTSNLLM